MANYRFILPVYIGFVLILPSFACFTIYHNLLRSLLFPFPAAIITITKLTSIIQNISEALTKRNMTTTASIYTARVKEIWDKWNLPSAVLTSLLFQVILTVLANSRKTRGSKLLTAIIWSSYLFADWVAAYAVGLISSGETNSAANNPLAAFWAPFLLLHLGGPDSITAFSLEDNELWIRHFFGLVIQLLAVVYVFLQSLPFDYWLPTALVFFAGTYKYAERTFALYRACLGNLKSSLLGNPDPGPNYAQFMQEYSIMKDSDVRVNIEIVKEPAKYRSSSSSLSPTSAQGSGLSDIDDIVVKGYDFFATFKGLVVDHMFSFQERKDSRDFFLSSNTSHGDAFKVLEVELNFMYDALYTKYSFVHCRIGYFCRFLCIALLAISLLVFASIHKNCTLVDKIVSYILLDGAICLDLVGLFNIVFSDWSIVSASKTVSAALIKLPFCRRHRRWSNTVSRHSFIAFCLKKRFRWLKMVAGFIGFEKILDEIQYKKSETCEESLKEFIFEELKAKAGEAETTEAAKEIYSARGEYILSKQLTSIAADQIGSSISHSLSKEVEYDESLLLWHIATELCFYTSSSAEESNQDRTLCKVLSDYMLYLLVMRPALMSAVSGIAQIRMQDSCAEARKFFKRFPSEADQPEKKACERLLKVKTDVSPNEVKGDRSKSLLFDACILAKDLKKLDDIVDNKRRWKMMSKVWVELLCYAAGRCRPDVHARQLNQGGEFVTFVWLLMVHFGLGEQFRIKAGHARAKLLVDK